MDQSQMDQGSEMDQKPEMDQVEVEDNVDGEGGLIQVAGGGFSAIAVGTKKKRGGQNAHRPNDTTRRQVSGMALAGLTHERIARLIGISDECLRRHYRAELENEGFVLGEIAQGLAQRAMDGDTVSSIFYLKARAGWRDQHVKIDGDVRVHDTAKHRLLDILATGKVIEHSK